MYSHLESLFLEYSEQVRNLRVILDSDLNFESNISNVTRTPFYHLKTITKVEVYFKLALRTWLMHSSKPG